jgi:hypothetical protein
MNINIEEGIFGGGVFYSATIGSEAEVFYENLEELCDDMIKYFQVIKDKQ